MPFSRPSLTEIYNRIKADIESRVTSGVKIPKFSLLAILTIVFTGAVHLLYGFLVWLGAQLFPDTADPEGVERWGRILKIPRKGATYSTGKGLFSGTPSTTVSLNTELENNDGLLYQTTEEKDLDISGLAEIDIESKGTGTDYNMLPDTGQTFVIVNPIIGVDSDVQITDGFDDAEDEETVLNWVLRILQRLQNPPSSGTTADYERWALEVAGVGRAWCFKAADWKGAGTVGLGVADENLEPVTPGVLQNVIDHLEANKPVPAVLDVFNTNPVDITYDIKIDPNVTVVQESVKIALTNLFLSSTKPAVTIPISHQQSSIVTAGVEDYEITEIYKDGSPQGVGDIVTTGIDVPRFDGATFTDL